MPRYRKQLHVWGALVLVGAWSLGGTTSVPSTTEPRIDRAVPLAPQSSRTTPTSKPALGAAPRSPDQIQATPTRTPTPINIGNFVWSDLNGNGLQDAGEPGVGGVAVQLWNAARTALLDTATTNSNGTYTVVAPLPGDYRVRVLLPSGNTFTLIDQGANDQIDSDINPTGVNFGFTDVFTIANNVISTTIYDAGLRPPPTPTRTPTPINIGNFVWHDLDEDGVQEAGEPGVGGVAVQLWNAAKTQLIDTATTNSNGTYTVVAPLPGDYRVRVLLPSGASFTPIDQGANDQIDSDINPTGVNFGFTDSFTIANNVISTTIYDAGLLNVQPSPTPTHTTTPTRTPTPTRTTTATATATATTTAPPLQRAYLPIAER